MFGLLSYYYFLSVTILLLDGMKEEQEEKEERGGAPNIFETTSYERKIRGMRRGPEVGEEEEALR